MEKLEAWTQALKAVEGQRQSSLREALFSDVCKGLGFSQEPRVKISCVVSKSRLVARRFGDARRSDHATHFGPQGGRVLDTKEEPRGAQEGAAKHEKVLEKVSVRRQSHDFWIILAEIPAKEARFRCRIRFQSTLEAEPKSEPRRLTRQCERQFQHLGSQRVLI